MSTKGLTREKIIAEAVVCIEESGQSRVSLHELARRLGIKTPRPRESGRTRRSRRLPRRISRSRVRTRGCTD